MAKQIKSNSFTPRTKKKRKGRHSKNKNKHCR